MHNSPDMPASARCPSGVITRNVVPAIGRPDSRSFSANGDIIAFGMTMVIIAGEIDLSFLHDRPKAILAGVKWLTWRRSLHEFAPLLFKN